MDQLSISKFAQPPHESIPDESKCTYQNLHWCNTIPNGNGDHSSDFGTSGKAGTLASAQPGLHNGQFRNWPTQLWDFSISSLLNQTHMEVEADVVVEHVSVPLDEWDDAWDGVMRPRRPGHHLPNSIAIAGLGGFAEQVTKPTPNVMPARTPRNSDSVVSALLRRSLKICKCTTSASVFSTGR